ncbi:uncharacterized protein VTP21DRAFT_1249 [Calcarisporiella thermophila]|uniref:uncharacterized protein n=1 Tax=Calcarisporiella thermophila TaxID=911321 RepID=UPI00374340C1
MGKRKSSDTKTNLILLQNIAEDDIIGNLKERFQQGHTFTALGDVALIVVNPFKELPCLSEATSAEYVLEYKNTAKDRDPLPPHIYKLTSSAYFHMRRTGLDQSVVLCGEVASGKTTMFNHVIFQLAALSAHQKKVSKIPTQVVNSAFVVEAFGHAKTAKNDNGSMVGKYFEVQFNERGRMIGTRVLPYLLDKARVVSVPEHERNFNVFYYLLAGASNEERNHYRLTDASHFRYTSMGKTICIPSVDDAASLNNLKLAMKSVGFRTKQIVQINQLLSAILHLGNIVFYDTANNSQDAARIRNLDTLNFASEMLGVDPRALENVLTCKTQVVKRDMITMLLNAEQAAAQRDGLAKALYSLLFGWILEHMNAKLSRDDFVSYMGLVDFPGLQSVPMNNVEQFCVNFANERFYQFILKRVFDYAEYREERITSVQYIPSPESDFINLCNRGLFRAMHEPVDKQSRTDAGLVDSLDRSCKAYDSYVYIAKNINHARSFGLNHFMGKVVYSSDGFCDRNSDALGADFVALFRGGTDIKPTSNSFIAGLFDNKQLFLQSHPRNKDAIINAQQLSVPLRKPTCRSRNNLDAEESHKSMICLTTQVRDAIEDLVTSLADTMQWYVFCLRPNDSSQPNTFESKLVKAQIRNLNLTTLTQRLKIYYPIVYTLAEFYERYAVVLKPLDIEVRDIRSKVETLRSQFGWSANAIDVGISKVFLAESAWRDLEDIIRGMDKSDNQRMKSERAEMGKNPYGRSFQNRSFMSGDDLGTCDYASEDEYFAERFNEGDSVFESEYNIQMGMYGNEKTDANGQQVEEMIEDVPETSSARKRWLFLVWLFTWPISNCCLSVCGLRRPDMRMAWREKVALCVLIFFLMGVELFFIIGLERIICPKQNVFSPDELKAHKDPREAYVAIRGEVFDLTRFAPNHWTSNLIPQKEIMAFAGTDASSIFPLQVSALCDGITGVVDPTVTLDYRVNSTNSIARYHDFRYFTQDYRKDWYWNQMTMLRSNFRVGYMSYSMQSIQDAADNQFRRWAVLNNMVFDLSDYIAGGRMAKAPNGQQPPPNVAVDFMHPAIVALFQGRGGQDITDNFNALPLEPEVKRRQYVCLRNLFFVGKVDTRNSLQCMFGEYILLAISVFMCSVILFKFLAAIQLGARREPEEHDRFIICQVPCYTESEESLRKTIDSLAVMKYDNKRKLLMIVCDGMIVGSGNDRPTPRIVLDILGVDPNTDPEPLSFISLGEGAKQHNMGKVYSGLYECNGHVVPYVVVVKVGRVTERRRPGNRGKRDSQMILMRFLNKVHYNKEMTPLELEMYHQIKNVIGVNPSMYEFILMVDADTEVMPDSLNRLVSTFMHDTRVIGLCGETMLANERDSWVTMIQVYEYYISHNLSKAFESLFGSVTCLPGCFCMYRIRTTEKNIPLIVSNAMVEDYGENRVDTLHKKNLLHLGEDRYLTTLMMKHFPTHKLKFIPDAQCRTNAPDRWSVLLSQRRRWINSTIHNLAELMFLPHLCGFCCFSMRFVVFIDLFATLVMPAMVIYLVYLLFIVVTSTSIVPWASIIMLCAVYGLQAFIFLIRRKWEHIGWMFFYIFAIPVFSFYIPLYAFWHFDDFSWGNTRVVVGEKGRKFVVTDEGQFDPRQIPTKKWSDYEQELWEVGTTASRDSSGTRYSLGSVRPARSFVADNADARSHYTTNHSVIGDQASARVSLRGAYEQDGRRYAAPSVRSETLHQRGPPLIDRVPDRGAPYADYPGGASNRGSMPLYARPMSPARPPSTSNLRPSSQSMHSERNLPEHPHVPSDSEIAEQVKRIVSGSDLMTITKKQVRDEVSAYFGVDMTPKKEYINLCIELVLQGRL